MRTGSILGAVMALPLVTSPVLAQTPGTPQVSTYEGAIGPYRIGLELTVQPDHKTIKGGHYFYVSKLTDIPLVAQKGADAIDLVEPGGGVFRMHLVGNGSEQGAPLDFYNSVGLAGTWSHGATPLAVTLQLGSGGDVPAPGRRYAMIGDAPDAVVEATAQRFLQAAISGNRDAAAAAVSYPLTVNLADGKTLTVGDKAALLAHWSTIFTQGYVGKLKTAVPHDMAVNYRGAMIANGAAWFNDNGATVLNTVWR